MKKILTLAALVLLATACGSTSTATTSSSSTSADGTVSLTPVQISEWGVEFTPVNSISDIRYAIDANHEDTANFSSASLISLDQSTGGSGCASADAPLGSLTRVVDFSAYTASSHTAPANVKIGDYYYFLTPRQGTCSNNQAVQNLQALQATDLASAMNSLKAIPGK